MTRLHLVPSLAALGLAATLVACSGMPSGKSGPSFFVTSAGPGLGADLGGLAGADKLCQQLASAAGLPSRTWRAYLSTTGADAVNARDRIGSGPWSNVKGELIAKNVDELHSAANNINRQTALTETGKMVNNRDNPPNMHDILTGSSPEGRSVGGDKETTCGNWTKSSDPGSAIVGHVDRAGLDDSAAAKSWNSSHGSAGCSQPALVRTGGAGLFYCFAAN